MGWQEPVSANPKLVTSGSANVSKGAGPISVAAVQPESGAAADAALFLFSTGFACGELFTRPGRKRAIGATEKRKDW